MKNIKLHVGSHFGNLIKLVLVLILFMTFSGCSMFRTTKPEPVPMGEVRFYIQQADELLKKGEYNQAVEEYNAALGLDPNNINARRKLAEAHASQGNNDLALEEFGKLTEINPNYAHAYNYRGYIYISQEKWKEAAKEFEKAVEAEPNNLYSLNQLGLSYGMLGRYDQAIETLQKAVALDPEMDDPESRDTHNYLGRVYRDAGRYEEAIAEFQKTLEHFPKDKDAHNYLGTVYKKMERYEDAIKEFETVLKMDPTNALAAQEYSTLSYYAIPPVEIVKEDVDEYIKNAPDAEEYPGDGAVVLLDKLSYEITNEGLTRYTVHQIVKILDKRGIAEFGEIAIPFNVRAQNIGVNVARTILPDGTVVEAADDAFHDVTPPGLSEYNLYSDTMLKIISMPALQPDAIIEYKATITDATAATERFWIYGGMNFQWIEPVLNAKCVLRIRKDIEIKWKLYNADIEPVITEDDDGRMTYIWISKNNQPVDLEVAMPPFQEVAPLLLFSSADSWDDVYDWYKELAEPQENADQAVKVKVAELIENKPTIEEKVKAIFRFVASEIRYVGIELGQGAYQPYSASEVLRHRYGDCKDKVTLLVTMLKEAGIEAHQVLISPAPHRRVDKYLPSIAQFSHVIAAVPAEDGSYVWLDPTVATCKYGDLPAGDQGRKAFVIGKEKGEFVETPVFPSFMNKTYSDSQISLSAEGDISGWEETVVTGQADMYLREIYSLIKPHKRQDFLQNILNQRYPGIQIQKVSISDLKDFEKPLSIKVDFSCPDYSLKTDDMLVFPLPSEGFSSYAALVGLSEREYDFDLGYNMEVGKDLKISIPEEFSRISLPADRNTEHSFGSFSRKYQNSQESEVNYSVSLKINKPIIPVDNYQNFKQFMETAAREDNAHIILTR
ncbi:tetratricopeptide repeat protein [Candidatus Poribacteria bacterium]|nr:tetratricopeptide repeat protein [Candidatus Poribacteria bacterium]